MTTSHHAQNEYRPNSSAPFVTYRGPRAGYTVVYLTDGSTIGMEGDQSLMLSNSIHNRKGHAVGEANGTRVLFNPAHIIGAYYTPKDAE